MKRYSRGVCDACSAYRQDNIVDSNSSLKENIEAEGIALKQGKGEDSDAISINADAYDSDIEGMEKNDEESLDMPALAPKSGADQSDELQMDIEKSVNEILGFGDETKAVEGAAIATPATTDVQPSAQQLELLELEMRARAIKALMKASDVNKQP